MLIASVPLYLKSRILLTQKLDLHPEIDINGGLRTILNDKRDCYDFPIVNFPFMFSNRLVIMPMDTCFFG